MERDGISKACTTKVMMKSPDTSTEAIPEIDSGNVSLGLASFFFSLCFLNKGLSLNMGYGPKVAVYHLGKEAVSHQPLTIKRRIQKHETAEDAKGAKVN